MVPETFRDLMRLGHGFEAAKIFMLAVEHDFFTPLEQESDAAELARLRGLDRRAVGLCLNALAALGILEKSQGRFRNGAAASRWLVQGANYRGHIFKHIHHCWDAWHRLDQVLHDGRPAEVAEDQALGGDEKHTRNFIRGMDDVTRELAPAVVAGLNLEGVRSVLDVGGGPGRYAQTFLETHPHLEQVVLFDLPGALEVASENLAEFAARDKVKLHPGDLHVDEFGEGVDMVWVSQVLHSLDEEGCQTLLAKTKRCLNPGGQLMIHEFLLDDDCAGPPQAALFAVHMLVMTAGGRAYSGAEIVKWLAELGFVDVRIEVAGPETRIVSGRLPT